MAQEKKRMRSCIVFIVIFTFLFLPLSVFAQATEYVLPYPPQMPGGYAYKLRVIGEKIQKIWSFGSFSQFSYNLKQSDKYLVQAKTLFEYKQYLLALESLKESDAFFKETESSLKKAKTENKNILEKRIILNNASDKHREVLIKLEQEVPSMVTWSPEKETSAVLLIKDALQNSLKIRKQKYE